MSIFGRATLLTTLLLGSATFAGCTTAYADHDGVPPGKRAVVAAGPRTALAMAPAKIRAPYDVQVVTEAGEALDTYMQGGRYYVRGDAGERYIIKVTNPTGRRVEAVVTVDGLDAVDGEDGDLNKRGYIVPPYGELKVEGFRTSTTDVATFRFSSVGGSYAGKKGKARNVGVIAVALFEEQAAPEIVAPTPPIAYDGRSYDEDGATGYRGEGKAGVADKNMAPPPADRPREPAPAPSTTAPTGGAGGARPAMPAPRRVDVTADREERDDSYGGPTPAPAPAKKERLGLGTEFGEARYSAVSYTQFVRAPGKPIAIAELRYNDTAGLEALGIDVAPRPDSGEIMTRETADPFPGDVRFSRPPAH